MRIGHVGLNSYLHRFNIVSIETCQYCNLPETLEHYLLYCGKYDNQRNVLKLKLSQINISSIDLKVLLAGDVRFNSRKRDIMEITMNYIRETKRFENP